METQPPREPPLEGRGMLNQLNSLAVLATREGKDVATYLGEVLRLLWRAEDLALAGSRNVRTSGLQVLVDALQIHEEEFVGREIPDRDPDRCR